jgi:hypothetical protein
MSKGSEAVKRWRKNTKQKLVNAMGGKCAICGYCKTHAALEFHHIDPNEKEFTFGAARGSIVNWNKLVEEAKKCILLCSNCHREVHEGISDLPEVIPSFSETHKKFENLHRIDNETDKKLQECVVCGASKQGQNVTCSAKCSAIRRRKIKDRPSIQQLLELLETNSFVKVGEMFGVSDNAIRKWLR